MNEAFERPANCSGQSEHCRETVFESDALRLVRLCQRPTCRVAMKLAYKGWSEEQQRVLIAPDGKEIPFPHIIRLEDMQNDRCRYTTRFVTEMFCSMPDFSWQEQSVPGSWGFIDGSGQVVIQPEYLYVTHCFTDARPDRCLAARYVEEDRVRWGMLDRNGNEVLPFEYGKLYSVDGADWVAFSREPCDLYGLMDWDGTVLMEPQFGVIIDFNREHGVLVVGDEDEAYGLYSLKEEKLLTDMDYEYISLEPDYVVCAYNYDEALYLDYQGNEVDPEDFEEDGEDITDEEMEEYFRDWATTEPAPFGRRKIYGNQWVVESHEGDARGVPKERLLTGDGQLVLEQERGYITPCLETGIIRVRTPEGTRWYEAVNK